ncbi:MAG: N-acetylmuramoyl-L-alanine amidase [Clostridiales bacterium]|nr:N-acetylmuramoyl-L-alanine amidase [Clostridiales bacterium]
MNKKTKGIIIALCCTIAVVITVCCGLVFSKSFRELILPDHNGNNEAETVYVRKESPVTRPANISGMYIRQDEDYQYNNLSAEEACQSIDQAIESALMSGVNTVYFDCLSNMTAVTVKGENGNTVNLLQYCVDTAHQKGLYVIISLNHNNNTAFISAEKYNNCIRSLIDTACFDAVVIPKITAEVDLEAKIKECVTAVRTAVDELHSPVEIMLESSYSYEENDYFSVASETLQDRTTDTLLIDPPQEDISTEEGFKLFIDDINKDLVGFSDDYIINYDISFGVDDRKNADICIKNLKYAEDNASKIGFIFYPLSAFRTEAPGIQLINSYLSSAVDTSFLFKEFAVTNYDKNEITTNESKIVFRGTCSPSYPLLCNGNEVEYSPSGDFALDYKLETGKNTIVFEQNGKKYEYTVTYDVNLIKSVTPKTESLVQGDSEIQLSCVALKGSKVTVKINGSTINMTEGLLASDNSEATPDESSDYTNFSCLYKVPPASDKVLNLGSFTVTATINNMTKSMKGGVIKVDKKFVLVTEEAPEETTEITTTRSQWTRPTYTSTETTLTDQSASEGEETTTEQETTSTPAYLTTKKLTPYSFNGISGTARMCEVTENYAKCMPASTLNESSVPMCTPQLSGTFDYIVSESSYEDDDGKYYYYNLASGLRIHRKNVKVIDKGYMLPANNIQSTSDIVDSQLAITVSPKWKVPFTSEFMGQSYSKGYNDLPYSIKSFTATGIEFIFYHTTKASGKFNLSDSRIIGDAQWTTNSDKKTSTLKLTFRSAGKFYGYTVKYDKNDNLVITIKNKPSSSLSGYTIMLDPGHGGTEAGSECAVKDPKFNWESKLNLTLSFKIKERLEKAGATVLMTRDTDKNILLVERVAKLRSADPDMFISVHCDSVTDSTVIGTSAFYYNAQSYPLSSCIHNRIVSAYKDTIYKKPKYAADYSEIIKYVDRYTKYYPFHVTRVNECPAILLEYGFSSNIRECLELQSDSTQNVLADATVLGIQDYIKKY